MAAEDEFRDFAVARSRSLRRTAYLLTGDHQYAEDLLQTTLTKVYLAWDRIRDPHAAEAYARRTLVTTYTSWWRRRSWQERPTDVVEEQVEPDGSDDLVDRADLWRLLHQLPRQQRAVLVLRFYEDLSVNGTAEALGIGIGTVKSHTSRALVCVAGAARQRQARARSDRGVIMPTTTDLRELLHDRADTASTAPPPVEAAIAGGRRVRAASPRRRRCRCAGGRGGDRAPTHGRVANQPSRRRRRPQPSAPTNGRVTSSSGFVVGTRASWPRAPGRRADDRSRTGSTSTVIDGTVQHELGGVVRRLLEVPEGLVALVDVDLTTAVEDDGHHGPTRIVLITDDGGSVEQMELDRGYI